MDMILETIEEALKRKQLSDAAASRLAVGHPSFIKNMRLSRDGEKRYNLPSLQKLAAVLDLEFYFGPRREAGRVEQIVLDGSEYAHIPVHGASLSAGPGADNGGTNITDHLAFRRDWLKRIGVSATKACLARVIGHSMEPTLWPGDLVLIDQTKTDPIIRKRAETDLRRAPIYAFVQDGEARVKRIERPNADAIMLLSDNPDFAPELRSGAEVEQMQVTIIGKVVWSGHTNKD